MADDSSASRERVFGEVIFVSPSWRVIPDPNDFETPVALGFLWLLRIASNSCCEEDPPDRRFGDGSVSDVWIVGILETFSCCKPAAY